MRFAIHERGAAADVPGYAYEGNIGANDVVPQAGDLVEIAGTYTFRVMSRRFCYDIAGGPMLKLDVTPLPVTVP